MFARLNGWQRLGCCRAVSLIPRWRSQFRTPAHPMQFSPREKSACQVERAGAEYGQPCYNLATFVQASEPVDSENSYRAAIQRRQLQMWLIALGIWFAVVAVLYGMGVAAGWVRAGFRTRTPNSA